MPKQVGGHTIRKVAAHLRYYDASIEAALTSKNCERVAQLRKEEQKLSTYHNALLRLNGVAV